MRFGEGKLYDPASCEKYVASPATAFIEQQYPFSFVSKSIKYVHKEIVRSYDRIRACQVTPAR
jgi:hypothetical protein